MRSKHILLPYIRFIIPLFLFFSAVQNSLRIILAIYEYHNIHTNIQSIGKIFFSGLIYDSAVFAYFLFPILLFFCLLSPNFLGAKVRYIYWFILLFFISYLIFLTATAEFIFWDEFNSRFNFIAVDYLVYTHEVIGNIRESYPIALLLALIAAASLLSAAILQRWIIKPYLHPLLLTEKLGASMLAILLSAASFLLVNPKISEVSQNRYLNELGKNGYFELFSAFRHNELSYKEFYITKPNTYLLPILRKQLQEPGTTFLADGITRKIERKGKEKRYNVVLITVESLSAEFLGVFGNKQNLTPYLDKLASESLLFTNTYAIGTRTVYGLAAINLSIPPLPGNSIIRRTHNENLFSLAAVLNSKGYESKFIYGGYGYFDNMNYFFAHNGYSTVDRSTFSKGEITFSNIWGVCDEDLFNAVLKESNNSYNSGKPFFNMVMTTSNHRPFTYPQGKIAIPSGTGRDGGVQYTDYALEQFIEKAKTYPWFANTIFIIVADHTASSAGKMELEKEKYHIPLLIYAPNHIKPATFDKLISQIDIPPTILGLLNMSYDSTFHGYDVLHHGVERAFISNYQKLGYLTPASLLILKPIKDITFYKMQSDSKAKEQEPTSEELDTAISYFQFASEWNKYNKLPDSKTPNNSYLLGLVNKCTKQLEKGGL